MKKTRFAHKKLLSTAAMLVVVMMLVSIMPASALTEDLGESTSEIQLLGAEIPLGDGNEEDTTEDEPVAQEDVDGDDANAPTEPAEPTEPEEPTENSEEPGSTDEFEPGDEEQLGLDDEDEDPVPGDGDGDTTVEGAAPDSPVKGAGATIDGLEYDGPSDDGGFSAPEQAVALDVEDIIAGANAYQLQQLGRSLTLRAFLDDGASGLTWKLLLTAPAGSTLEWVNENGDPVSGAVIQLDRETFVNGSALGREYRGAELSIEEEFAAEVVAGERKAIITVPGENGEEDAVTELAFGLEVEALTYGLDFELSYTVPGSDKSYSGNEAAVLLPGQTIRFTASLTNISSAGTASTFYLQDPVLQDAKETAVKLEDVEHVVATLPNGVTIEGNGIDEVLDVLGNTRFSAGEQIVFTYEYTAPAVGDALLDVNSVSLTHAVVAQARTPDALTVKMTSQNDDVRFTIEEPQLSMTASVKAATRGSTFTYAVQYVNNTNADAAVTVTPSFDSLLTGDTTPVDVGTVPANGYGTVEFEVTVDSTISIGYKFNSSAVVTVGGTAQPTIYADPLPVSDFWVESDALDNQETVLYIQLVNYTIHFTNPHNNPATVTISTTLPLGWELSGSKGLDGNPVGTSSDGYEFNDGTTKFEVNGNTLTWTINSVPAGTIGWVELTLRPLSYLFGLKVEADGFAYAENSFTYSVVDNTTGGKVEGDTTLRTPRVPQPKLSADEYFVWPGDTFKLEVDFKNWYAANGSSSSTGKGTVEVTQKIDPALNLVGIIASDGTEVSLETLTTGGYSIEYDTSGGIGNIQNWIYESYVYNEATATLTMTYANMETYSDTNFTMVVKAADDAETGVISHVTSYEINKVTWESNKVYNEIVRDVPGKRITSGQVDTVYVGEFVDYKVDFVNKYGTAKTITIEDTLPEGLDFVSANYGTALNLVYNGEDVPISDNNGALGSSITYDPASRKITFTLANVDPYTIDFVEIEGQVAMDAVKNGITSIKNVAIVEGEEYEGPKLDLPKGPNKTRTSAADLVFKGERVSYEIEYVNYTSKQATITIRDELSWAYNLVSVTAPDAPLPEGVWTLEDLQAGKSQYVSLATDGRTLTWTIPEVDPGENGTVGIVVEVGENAVEGQILNNTAYVTVDGQTSPVSADPVTVGDTPVKDALSLAAVPGGAIEYELYYRSLESDPVKLTITDDLSKYIPDYFATGDVEITDITDDDPQNHSIVNASWAGGVFTLPEVTLNYKDYIRYSVKITISEDVLDNLRNSLGNDELEYVDIDPVENTATFGLSSRPGYEAEADPVKVVEPGKNEKTVKDLRLNGNSPDTVYVGEDITYLISYTNNGAAKKTSTVFIVDTLPIGVDFVSASANGEVLLTAADVAASIYTKTSSDGSASVTYETVVNGKYTQAKLTWRIHGVEYLYGGEVSADVTVNMDALGVASIANEADIYVVPETDDPSNPDDPRNEDYDGPNGPGEKVEGPEQPTVDDKNDKIVDITEAWPGDELGYTIKWHNYTGVEAEITITDTIAAEYTIKYVILPDGSMVSLNAENGYSYDDGVGTKVSYNTTSRALVWSFKANRNAFGLVKVTVAVNPDANPGKVENRAEITFDGKYTAEVRSEDVDILKPLEKDVSIAEVNGSRIVKQGESFLYTLSFENHKDSDAYITIWDNLSHLKEYIAPIDPDSDITISTSPAGGSVQQYSYTDANGEVYSLAFLAKLEAGQSVEITIQVTVLADADEGTLLNNTAHYLVENADPGYGPNGPDEEAPEDPFFPGKDTDAPEVEVGKIREPGKSVNWPDDGTGNLKTAYVGDELEYTITWANPADTKARVVIYDYLPAGVELVSASVGNAVIGEGDPGDIWQAVDGGNTVRYNTQTGLVTWIIESAGQWSDGTVGLTVRVTEAALDKDITFIRNEAYVYTIPLDGGGNPGEGDPDPEKPTKPPVVTPPIPTPDGPEKNADTAISQQNGLITYTVTWNNYKNKTGTVKVSDSLPEGFTLVGVVLKNDDSAGYTNTSVTEQNSYFEAVFQNVAPGKGGEILITVRVNEKAVPGSTIKNVATVTITPDGGTEGPGKEVPGGGVDIGGPVEKTVSVQEEGGKRIVQRGQEFTYTLSYENKTNALVDLTIWDDLSELLDNGLVDEIVEVKGFTSRQGLEVEISGGPDYTFYVEGLAKGETVTIEITVKVAGDAQDDEVLENIATYVVREMVDGEKNTEEAKPEDGEKAPAPDVVVGVPNIPPPDVDEPSKTVDWTFDENGVAETVAVGEELEYTITYANKNAEKARVVVYDRLPVGVDLVSAAAGGVTITPNGQDATDTDGTITVSYNAATRLVTWEIKDVAAYSNGDVTLTVKVNEDALDVESIQNGAFLHVIPESGDNGDKPKEPGDKEKPDVETPPIPTPEPDDDAKIEGKAEKTVKGITPEDDGRLLVEPGQEFTYVLRYTSETDALVDVTIWDNLGKLIEDGLVEKVVKVSATTTQQGLEAAVSGGPDYTIYVEGLAKGETVTVEITVKVAGDAKDGDILNNTGSFLVREMKDGKPNTEKPDPKDENVQKEEAPDVEVEDPAGPNPKPDEPSKTVNWAFDENGVAEAVEVGEELEYTITYANKNAEKARVVVYDRLPVGVDLVSAGADGVSITPNGQDATDTDGTITVSYNAATRLVSWEIKDVAAYSNGDVTLTVKVNEDALDVESIQNGAFLHVIPESEDNGDKPKEPGDKEKPDVETPPIPTPNGGDKPEGKAEKTVKGITPEGDGRLLVEPGQEFTYVLRYTSEADALVDVTIWDNLGKLIEDGLVEKVVKVNATTTQQGLEAAVSGGPDYTIYVEGLAKGESVAVEITVKVAGDAQDGDILNNTGSFLVREMKDGKPNTEKPDPKDENVQKEEAPDVVVEEPNGPGPNPREMTKTVDWPHDEDGTISKPVHVGDILDYTITYANNADTNAYIKIVDKLPVGVQFVSAEVGDAKLEGNPYASAVLRVSTDDYSILYNSLTGTVTWEIYNVDAWGHGAATLRVIVTEAALGVSGIRNEAEIYISPLDEDGNKTDPDPDPEKPVVTPEIPTGGNENSKEVDKTKVEVGKTVTYTINWHNYTNETADITVTDKLDSRYVLESATDASGKTYTRQQLLEGKAGSALTFDASSNTLTWSIPGVETDAQGSVKIAVKASAGTKDGDTISNQALVQMGEYIAKVSAKDVTVTDDGGKDKPDPTTSPGGKDNTTTSKGGDKGNSSSSKNPGTTSTGTEEGTTPGGNGGTDEGGTDPTTSRPRSTTTSNRGSSRPGTTTQSATSSTTSASSGSSSAPSSEQPSSSEPDAPVTPEESSTSTGGGSNGGNGANGGYGNPGDSDYIQPGGSISLFGSDIPMGGLSTRGGWSLFNLIVSVLALLSAVIMLVRLLAGKRKRETEAEYDEEDPANIPDEDPGMLLEKRRTLWMWLSFFSGLLPLLAFLILENFTRMVMFTRWTPLIFALGLLHLVLVLIQALRHYKKPEEEEQEPEEA